MSNLRRSAYLLAFCAAVAFSLSHIWTPAPPPKYTGLSHVRVPETVAGFQSQGEDPVSDPVRAALSAADLVSRTYKNNNGKLLQFTMISGTDRSALHDPRSCLVGAGWRIENEHTETIPGAGIDARVCQIVQDSTRENYEVIYLYIVNREIVTHATQIRFRMLTSALIGKANTPTVFIRLMRPLQKDSISDATNRRLFLEFARQMWEALRSDVINADTSQPV